MAYKPVTVTQLGTYLKQMVDAEEMLYNISVTGEISGITSSRGVAYFTLKDQNASIGCVCFYLDRIYDFKNGDSVVVVGSAKYYVKGGKLNFNVDRIEHYGESVLFKQFLELKAKLEDKGYFSELFKIPMPKTIKRIGVVSSETGAVIQDIINVRTRRNPSIDIVLYPVKVQGENAEYEIANGIKFFDSYNVDAIIVARGGGSFEDLQPFNTEVVADAVFNCNKFIMSAVGHETDYTIIDFVSDLRAPTPSAAAELLCNDLKTEKFMTIEKIKSFIKAYDFYLQSRAEKIGRNWEILNFNIEQLLKSKQYYIVDNTKKLLQIMKVQIDIKDKVLNHKSEIIKKLNPNEILKLGYASLKSKNKYVTSINNVEIGDEVEICLKDGKLKSVVSQVLR